MSIRTAAATYGVAFSPYFLGIVRRVAQT